MKSAQGNMWRNKLREVRLHTSTEGTRGDLSPLLPLSERNLPEGETAFCPNRGLPDRPIKRPEKGLGSSDTPLFGLTTERKVQNRIFILSYKTEVNVKWVPVEKTRVPRLYSSLKNRGTSVELAFARPSGERTGQPFVIFFLPEYHSQKSLRTFNRNEKFPSDFYSRE